MLWGGCRGPLHTGHLPPYGWCFPICFTPTLIGWIPCASVCFSGYLHVIWGILPLCWGLRGNSPICWGYEGHQHLCQALVSGSTSIWCPLCFILYLSCSSLCLTYLPWLWLLLLWLQWCLLVVIYFISDHGPFLDGASCNIGLVWSGPAATLDAKMPWRYYWPCLCATAATSIFNASSGLCQLCFMFSTGRFLCQSWASQCFVYYMFGIHFGVCFLLSGAKLVAVLPYGGSIVRVCTIATLWSLPMAGICATWWWSSVHTWYA